MGRSTSQALLELRRDRWRRRSMPKVRGDSGSMTWLLGIPMAIYVGTRLFFRGYERGYDTGRFDSGF